MTPKVQKIALIFFAICMIVACIFFSRGNYVNRHNELFGDIISVGSQYIYSYGNNPDECFRYSENSGYVNFHLLEDFVNDIINRSGGVNQSIWYPNNGLGNEYLLEDAIENYDVKILSCEINPGGIIERYLMYIKGDTWVVTDAMNNVIAGMNNFYGLAIKAVFDELVGNGYGPQ